MRWVAILAWLLHGFETEAQTRPELSCLDGGKPDFVRMPPLELVPFDGPVEGPPDWRFGPFDVAAYGFAQADVYIREGMVVDETSQVPGGLVHELELSVHVSGGAKHSWRRLGGANWQAPNWLRITADHERARVRLAAEGLPIFHVEYPDFWSGNTPWGVKHQLILDFRDEPKVLASLECATLAGSLGACGSIDAAFGEGSVTSCVWSAPRRDFECHTTLTMSTLRGKRFSETRFLLTTAVNMEPSGTYSSTAELARAIATIPGGAAATQDVAGYGKLRLVHR